MVQYITNEIRFNSRDLFFFVYFGFNVNFGAYNNLCSETSFKAQGAYFGTDIRLTLKKSPPYVLV